ncbi:glycosyltransferase 87 family protein [Streptomyces murinus]|uniref:glycosyltransferase 87 family protein n=1 Tax=Streptomyces murinus TaxID=33900 RepID=UPI00372D1122
MTGPRTERGRLLLVLALAAAVTAFSATVPLLRGFFDLRVYYGTVHTWVHHGGLIYDWSLALCALALFEPLRDTTFSFGQVNVVLLALVLTDARLLSSGRGRWAGAGIGLAAAIKLTPALFIGLLLLAGRRRAAAQATAVAAAVTALAALVDPAASRFYWTRALWDTSRVGRLDYVSNQSLQGVLARLGETGRPLWALAVLGTLCVWAWRGRRAALAGDWTAAFALTGAAACLVSPITWVHHLVWLLPSFAVLLRAGHRRLAGALYAVLCTSVVWLWFDDASGLDGFLGSNLYTWITLGLLLGLPIGQPRAALPLPLALPLARSASAIAAAPSPASPAPTAVPDQSSSSGAPDVAAATGAAEAAGRGLGRSPSSEPTGST